MRLLIAENYPRTWAFVANWRFPQLLYHAGLVLVGAGIGILYAIPGWKFNLGDILRIGTIVLGVWCAWISSVVVNDVVDLRIDRISNPDRPLPRNIFSANEYLALGAIFFFFSLLLVGIVGWTFFFLIFLYQAVAFIYSAWPFRLKRFPFVGTFVSALASILLVFSGFIVLSPDRSLAFFPWPIAFFLVLGYTLSLPVKDFKDIDGDAANGVWTIPVVFGAEWGKVAVGSGIFFSFMLSVLVLGDFRLFWPAFGCGSFAFAAVLNMKKPALSRWLHYRNIFWWLIGSVTIYLGTIVCYFLK